MTINELRNFHPNNINVFEKFKHDIGNVVPIFGAGISARFFAPWKVFLKELSRKYGIQSEINELISKGNYDEATTYLKNYLGYGDFYRTLKTAYATEKIEIEPTNPLLILIPILFDDIVITTNIDKTIEKAYEKAGKQFDYVITPSSMYVWNKVEIKRDARILIKLKGDINDIENLVLDKETFDDVYGLDKPSIKALDHICRAKKLLFLGCSMEEKNLLQLLNSIFTDTYEHYAIIELPKETENINDPMHPILRISEVGPFIPTLLDKMKYLSDHLINAMWYPYGQHQSVQVFLRELLSYTPAIYFIQENENKYVHPYGLFGRKSEVNRIIDSIHSSEGNIIIVQGAPGIGKTEICKEVLARFSKEKEIIYLDTITYNELLSLLNTLDNHLIKNKLLVYIDNFENVLVESNFDEKNSQTVYDLIKQIASPNIQFLISTRISLNMGLDTIYIEKLPLGAAKELFLAIWYSKNNSILAQYNMLDDLLNSIDCHPLSIVLLASEANGLDKIESVINNTLHETLKTSWDSVKKNNISLKIWGLVSLCPNEVDVDIIEEAVSANKEAIMIAIKKLVNANLIRFNNEDKLEMLSPLRGICFIFGKEDNNLSEIECIQRLGICYLQRLNNARENFPDHLTAHNKVLNVLPNILYFMNIIIDKDECINILEALSILLCNYYKYSLQSLEVIKKMLKIFTKETNKLLYCRLEENIGELQSRLGLIDEAMESYKEAEAIFRDEQNNLGVANILYSRGNLQDRLGRIEEALASYDEAEIIYRIEHATLGLANVLKSRGNLQKRLGIIDKASKCYDEAEKLYSMERDNLGLANVLQGKGDLQSRLGQIEEALVSYANAEKLHRAERNNLGLANVMQSKGDLQSRLGQMEEAEGSYEEVEKLYRAEQNNLGLANVLQSRGNLQIRLSRIEEALESYGEAEKLYRSVRDNLGLANVLQSRGELQSRMGQVEEAMESYGEAEKLYRMEQDNIGLANVIRIRGELNSRMGQIEKALRSYEEAEKLFRAEHHNLGLANVLLCRGALEKSDNRVALAEKYYTDAAELYIREKDNTGLIYTLAELCDVYSRKDKKEELRENIFRSIDIMQHKIIEHAGRYAFQKIVESMQRVKWLDKDLKPLKACPEDLAQIFNALASKTDNNEKTS